MTVDIQIQANAGYTTSRIQYVGRMANNTFARSSSASSPGRSVTASAREWISESSTAVLPRQTTGGDGSRLEIKGPRERRGTIRSRKLKTGDGRERHVSTRTKCPRDSCITD